MILGLVHISFLQRTQTNRKVVSQMGLILNSNWPISSLFSRCGEVDGFAFTHLWGFSFTISHIFAFV